MPNLKEKYQPAIEDSQKWKNGMAKKNNEKTPKITHFVNSR